MTDPQVGQIGRFQGNLITRAGQSCSYACRWSRQRDTAALVPPSLRSALRMSELGFDLNPF